MIPHPKRPCFNKSNKTPLAAQEGGYADLVLTPCEVLEEASPAKLFETAAFCFKGASLGPTQNSWPTLPTCRLVAHPRLIPAYAFCSLTTLACLPLGAYAPRNQALFVNPSASCFVQTIFSLRGLAATPSGSLGQSVAFWATASVYWANAPVTALLLRTKNPSPLWLFTQKTSAF